MPGASFFALSSPVGLPGALRVPFRPLAPPEPWRAGAADPGGARARASRWTPTAPSATAGEPCSRDAAPGPRRLRCPGASSSWRRHRGPAPSSAPLPQRRPPPALARRGSHATVSFDVIAEHGDRGAGASKRRSPTGPQARLPQAQGQAPTPAPSDPPARRRRRGLGTLGSVEARPRALGSVEAKNRHGFTQSLVTFRGRRAL